MAHISPTSVRVPIILTRTCVPGSITMSSLLVNCGGVALGSHLVSLGISCDTVNQRDSNTRQLYGTAQGDTHMSRHKQSKGTSLGEETLWIDGVDNGINLIRVRQLLASEGAGFALPSLL